MKNTENRGLNVYTGVYKQLLFLKCVKTTIKNCREGMYSSRKGNRAKATKSNTEIIMV